MAVYTVDFTKVVTDSTGHDHRIRQRRLEVRADDADEAHEKAARRFCEKERVRHWTNHADDMEVKLARE